jgi:hypothetical protein
MLANPRQIAARFLQAAPEGALPKGDLLLRDYPVLRTVATYPGYDEFTQYVMAMKRLSLNPTSWPEAKNEIVERTTEMLRIFGKFMAAGKPEIDKLEKAAAKAYDKVHKEFHSLFSDLHWGLEKIRDKLPMLEYARDVYEGKRVLAFILERCSTIKIFYQGIIRDYEEYSSNAYESR